MAVLSGACKHTPYWYCSFWCVQAQKLLLKQVGKFATELL